MPVTIKVNGTVNSQAHKFSNGISNLEELHEYFRVERDGALLVDLCVELVVLVDGPIGPSLPGIQSVYDSFMSKWGKSVRLCSGYDDADMRAFEPEQWKDVSKWLDAELQYGSGSFGGHFQAGKTPVDCTPPSLDIVHYAPSRETSRVGIQIRLPLEVLQDGTDHLRSYFLSVIERLSLNYALCGMSIAWNAEQNDAASAFERRTIPRLLRRPGVGMGDFAFLVTHAPAGLMTINWLTALGARLQERVGPLATSPTAWPDAVQIVANSSNAVVFQAGPRPVAGDVNRRDDAPAYRALAKLLRAAWASDDYIGNISYGHMEPELGDRWVGRFFD